MYKIMGGRAEALEFIVPAGAAYAGIPLAELNVDESSLIAVIVRGNRVIVPFGADTVEAGDHVVAITRRSGTLSLGDILEI